MKERARRRYIKIHSAILNSSFNYELTLAEQAVFIKLIVLAGDLGFDGFICSGDGEPLEHYFIAGRVSAPIEVLEATLSKCIKTNRVKENSAGIEIINWQKYQPEYDRQKPYREAKKETTGNKDFKAGKYGNMVASTADDVKDIKELRNGR